MIRWLNRKDFESRTVQGAVAWVASVLQYPFLHTKTSKHWRTSSLLSEVRGTHAPLVEEGSKLLTHITCMTENRLNISRHRFRRAECFGSGGAIMDPRLSTSWVRCAIEPLNRPKIICCLGQAEERIGEDSSCVWQTS